MSLKIRAGMVVVGLDGDKLGDISGLDGEFLLVKGEGMVAPEYQVPRTAVAADDGETVRLSVSKDEAIEQRWPGTPAGDAE